MLLDSDDENEVEIINRSRPEDRSNPLYIWKGKEFQKRYRMSHGKFSMVTWKSYFHQFKGIGYQNMQLFKVNTFFPIPETFLHLLKMIDTKMEFKNDINSPLTPMLRLCVALRFYAMGSFYQVTGQLHDCSSSQTCNVVWQVTQLICSLYPAIIVLSKMEAKCQQKCAGFYQISKFPGIWGAIDCTQVPIMMPSEGRDGISEPEVFRNCKGYFIINVQAVCDATSTSWT